MMKDHERTRVQGEVLRAFQQDLLRAAEAIFSSLGAASDFAVQVEGEVWDSPWVFGGVNRVQWTLERGFQPDPEYCSTRFLEAWEGAGYPTTARAHAFLLFRMRQG